MNQGELNKKKCFCIELQIFTYSILNRFVYSCTLPTIKPGLQQYLEQIKENLNSSIEIQHSKVGKLICEKY